jgi:hypothetical protein
MATLTQIFRTLVSRDDGTARYVTDSSLHPTPDLDADVREVAEQFGEIPERLRAVRQECTALVGDGGLVPWQGPHVGDWEESAA